MNLLIARLAIKYTLRHPAQSLLTILGISGSISVVLAATMLNSAIDRLHLDPMVKGITLLLALMSVFLSAFITYKNMKRSVEQSKQTIGLLRSAGVTDKQIKNFFFQQCLVYSLVASILGICAGILTEFGFLFLMHLMLRFKKLFFELPSIQSVLLSTGIGTAVTLVIGAFWALSASKSRPK